MVTGEDHTHVGQPVPAGPLDVFVSYTGADEAWATWVAEVLEAEQQTVRVQAWDSPAGENFVVWISAQMAAAGRTVAICSPAYFDSHWCTQEWTGALACRKITPVRVGDVALPDVLNTIGYRDLHGVDEATARRRLLEAVGLRPVERTSTGFPGQRADAPATPGVAAAFPGRRAAVFTVPGRLRHFTGRQPLLDAIATRLTGGGPVAIAALHGLGGVGKTQLAVEYAHRHAADYRTVIWIDAEQTPLIATQLAALTGQLGLPTTGLATDDAATVLDALRHQTGWLLVYDNAEDPATLRPWLTDGDGHTLITSRHTGWRALADPIEIDVMTRPDAIALLTRRIPGLDPDLADQLADQLGDLPLALEQAAAYIDTTATPAGDYLALFQGRRDRMLTKGQAVAHGATIDTLWTLTLDRLRDTTPAAVALLEVCAQLGPDPIPLPLLQAPDGGDDPAGPWPVPVGEAFDDAVGAVVAFSLARRARGSLTLHRLLAAAIRAHQSPGDRQTSATTAGRLLAAAATGDPDHPDSWPVWTRLAPHLLTAPALHPDDPTVALDDGARRLLLRTSSYLTARGDDRAAATLDQAMYDRDRRVLGEDHPDTLTSANNFALDLRELGDYQAARTLDEETLTRKRRVLGGDHPDTLTSANNLAGDLRGLGDYQAARTLDEDTLTRTRRVLGDDHPSTLRSANNLADDLRGLGDYQVARALDEDTLTRKRRVLGDDHPNTLRSASNFALDLRGLGDYQAARALDEETLTRKRRVLGDDHPDTLTSANNLAGDLRELGDYQAARALDEDTLTRRRRILGDDHPHTLTSASNLAHDLRQLGEVAGAQTPADEVRRRPRG